MDWKRRNVEFRLTCLKPREDMADDESLGWGTERGREKARAPRGGEGRKSKRGDREGALARCLKRQLEAQQTQPRQVIDR